MGRINLCAATRLRLPFSKSMLSCCVGNSFISHSWLVAPSCSLEAGSPSLQGSSTSQRNGFPLNYPPTLNEDLLTATHQWRKALPACFGMFSSLTCSPILWRDSELQYDVLHWFSIMRTTLVPLRLGSGCADCSSLLMPSIEQCLSWHSEPFSEVFHLLKIHRALLLTGGEGLHRDSCHTRPHPSSTMCLSSAALMADRVCPHTDNSLLCFTIG